MSTAIARWSDPAPEAYAHGAASTLAWRFDGGGLAPCVETVIEEVPIALVFDGEAPIVMMATPLDSEDFARGFAISEGIVDDPSQIVSIDSVPANGGLLVQIGLADGLATRVAARRRAGAASSGCGLCGSGEIAQVLRLPGLLPQPEAALPQAASASASARVAPPLPTSAPALPDPGLGPSPDMRTRSVDAAPFSAAAIHAAFDALPRWQTLGARTGSAHGAAFADADGRVLAFAEDAGRHNALDKLIGKITRLGLDPSQGFAAVTSRASFEMAQKAVAARLPMLCSISAPTGLAIRLAQASGLTLCAFVRETRFTCYAAPHRIAT